MNILVNGLWGNIMSKLRKYDYIFFDNRPKERILKWFQVKNDWYFMKDFILITKDHVYWYTERRTDEDGIYDSKWISKRNYLYQLKSGVYTLDISNYKLWNNVEDFNRFEIMVEAK